MNAVLDPFRNLGFYTSPGDYAFLYEGLPLALEDVCRFIKQQFIHPSQTTQFGEAIPATRRNESNRFVTVEQMLEELLNRNAAGLVSERPPEQRLIVSCRHHALLLASVLKWRGVPARVRVGFAAYVSAHPQQRVDHWVCEVWNAHEERWMLVDPDLERVDLPSDDFEFAGDVWLQAREGTVDPQRYGCAPRWGLGPIRNNLCHDFEAVLGHESNYHEGPPLFHASLSALGPPQRVLLDFMAQWLQDPDANYEQLTLLRDQRPELRRS